jgi:hypothetical protein
MPKISNLANNMRRAGGGAFILPSVGWASPLPSPHIRTCPLARHTPMRPRTAHRLGPDADRRGNSRSDCGARPVQSEADAATVCCFETPPDDRGGTVELSLLRAGNNQEPAHERMNTAMILLGAGPPSRSNCVSAAT